MVKRANRPWLLPASLCARAHGVWDKDDTGATGRRLTQYVEMFGSRAIYHDGWIASAPPIHAPWDLSLAKLPADVMNGFPWDLYNLNEDWTQATDLAAKMPDKLRDMQQLFTMEAAKYQCSRSTTPVSPVHLGEAELLSRPARVHLFGQADERAIP